MPINDTDPHRRNLVVISLCYFLIAIGEGRIEDGKPITLPMVNVDFGDPGALAWCAWIMLCWFGYRY